MDILREERIKNYLYSTDKTTTTIPLPNITTPIIENKSMPSESFFPSISTLLDELGAEQIRFSFGILQQILQDGPIVEQLSGPTKIICLLPLSHPIALDSFQPLKNKMTFNNSTLARNTTSDRLNISLPSIAFKTGTGRKDHTVELQRTKGEIKESFFCGHPSPREIFKITVARTALSKIDTKRIKISGSRHTAVTLHIEQFKGGGRNTAPEQLEHVTRQSLCKFTFLED